MDRRTFSKNALGAIVSATTLGATANAFAQNNKAVPLITADGIYGDKTKAAVIAVQKLSGIPQTGAVGPLTWNAIVNLYNEYR